MKPGIYFDLPEADYHRDPALSASGIKRINISPLDYWMYSPLNPEPLEEVASGPRDLGTAYHKLLLEGQAAFDACYAVEPERDDYPDALVTQADMKAWLRGRALKLSGTNAELVARIREQDSDVPLWHEIMARFEAENEGKIILSRQTMIELARARTVVMQQFGDLLSGGCSEVSIFWIDERTGTPMKARIDYLRPKGGMLDVKTFGNVRGLPVEQAAVTEITRNNYHIQAVLYCQGLDAIRALWRKHGMEIVHGLDDDLWLESVLNGSRNVHFAFLFVQSGPVPNVIMRRFERWETYAGNGATANGYWQVGEIAIRHGVDMYRQCMTLFGPHEAWVADYGRAPLRDTEFPLWFLGPQEAATA